MKTRTLVMLLITALFCWSCAGKAVLPTQTISLDPGDQLFARAEKHFHSNLNKEALQLYNEYLVQYPGGSNASAALLKIGAINVALKDYSAARQAYQRLIEHYPGSFLVTDAKIGILLTLYHEGRYSDIIKESEAMRKTHLARHNLLRILILQGDTYLSAGAPTNAFLSYFKAYQIAGIEKNDVMEKLNAALFMLSSTEIASILEDMDDFSLKGNLLYRLGLAYTDEGQYHRALNVLSEFVDQFPQHDHASNAAILIQSLEDQAQYDHFTIGCMLPLSGPYKLFGNNALKGIEIALDQFSRQDIYPNFKIIVKDTESDPRKAAMAVKELADQGVAAIIGPLITAKAAAVEAENQGIPIITLTQKADVTDIGQFVFRNFLTPQMQVETLVSFAANELDVNRFAILYPDENYGHTFSNLFREEVLRHGGTITGAERYQSDQTDFAEPIKKLIGESSAPKDPNENGRRHAGSLDAKPVIDFEAVFIPDAPAKTGLILPQLIYHDITNVYLLGTNLWYSGALIKMAGQHCQGAIMPGGFFAESEAAHVRDFVSVFEKNYQETPDFLAAVSYDSAVMLLEILSRHSIRFRSELNEKLLDLKNFQGVTGLTSFKPNGDAEKQLYLLQIRDNRFVEVPYSPTSSITIIN